MVNYQKTYIFSALFYICFGVSALSGADSRRDGIARRGKNVEGSIKYEAKDIDEDVPIGTAILKVKASEFVSNAEIKYSVSDNHFTVDSNGVISNAKQLDADSSNNYYEFNVTATVMTTVRVSIKNKNDQEPKFSQGVYTANVSGNAAPKTLVMTVNATDMDGDNVRYAFARGGTRSGQFVIEETTGAIRLHGGSSYLDCDRYELNVTATDDGACCGRIGPTHTSTAVVVVNIVGRNDTHVYCECRSDAKELGKRSSSLFNQTMYTAVIAKDELTQSLPLKLIRVAVTSDGDEKKLVYSLDGQGIDADNPINSNFDINQTTGEIYVRKSLDVNQPNGRSRWRFSVFAKEEGTELGCADVQVKLRNYEELFFEKDNIETSVYENAGIGTIVEKFKVVDDHGDRTKVVFAIDQTSDLRQQFAIDQNGIVTIQKHLDREDTARHQLNILASYDTIKSKTATASLTVNVQDVNDNAPRFLKDYRPILMEHVPPRKVAEIMAMDDDDWSKGNGPPFHFRLDPKADDIIRASFKIDHVPKGDNGSGMAIVSSLRLFDREQGKEYHVPIVIKDSGKPAMTSTSTLTVVIGDINDNKMQEGFKEIFVYNYLGQAPNTEIGRVYVYDLDDWDLPDKKFYWNTEEHLHFSLNEDTGMLTMHRGTPEGSYRLRFLVSDFKHNQIDVPARVTIHVREIPEETVMANSGSIRVVGITDENFLQPGDDDIQNGIKSKFNKLREKLGQLLAIDKENVEIFSIQMRQQLPPITDIYFLAHESVYFKSVKLNGIALQHREEIEDYVGISITMIGINECLKENTVCQGSCTNVLKVNPLPYLIHTNKTALVGVDVKTQPECTCRALSNISRDNSCSSDLCYNGGSCIENENGTRCKCPSGFDGPRCQKTTRSFLDSDWGWYPALEMCDHSHLSIEFLLKNKSEGNLFYNGPIAPLKSGDISDFISLELESGRPRLLINFGSGTLELVIKLNETTLNDGDWHRIDVFWDTEIVRMVLDRCDNIAKIEVGAACEINGTMPSFSKYLDVNWPLQIGGVSHFSLGFNAFKTDHFSRHGKGFSGCIRNFIYNSKIYDLGNHGMWHESRKSWLSFLLKTPPGDGLCPGSNISRHDDSLANSSFPIGHSSVIE